MNPQSIVSVILIAGFVKVFVRAIAAKVVSPGLVSAVPDLLVLLVPLGFLFSGKLKPTLPRRPSTWFLLFWAIYFVPMLWSQTLPQEDTVGAVISSRYLFMFPLYYYAFHLLLERSQSLEPYFKILDWCVRLNLIYLFAEFVLINFVPGFFNFYMQQFGWDVYRPFYIFSSFFKANGITFGVQHASFICAMGVLLYSGMFGAPGRVSRFWLLMSLAGFAISFTVTAVACLGLTLLATLFFKGSPLYRYRHGVVATAPFFLIALRQLVFLKWGFQPEIQSGADSHYSYVVTSSFNNVVSLLQEHPFGMGSLAIAGDAFNGIGFSDVYFFVALLCGGYLMWFIIFGFATSQFLETRTEFLQKPSSSRREFLLAYMISLLFFLSAIHYDTWIQSGYGFIYALCLAIQHWKPSNPIGKDSRSLLLGAR